MHAHDLCARARCAAAHATVRPGCSGGGGRAGGGGAGAGVDGKEGAGGCGCGCADDRINVDAAGCDGQQPARPKAGAAPSALSAALEAAKKKEQEPPPKTTSSFGEYAPARGSFAEMAAGY